VPIDYPILTPKEFVFLCADVLDAEGFEEVRVIEGPGDWKEDVHADEVIHSQSGVYEILHFRVQCKHYAKSGDKVKLDEVNEMFPYLFSTNANRLLIITDTDLTTQAKQEIVAFNEKNPIKRVIYWTNRELDNRLLKHRLLIEKYFPTKAIHSNTSSLNCNPYKLLESYKESDSANFFGRTNDIQALLESVYRDKITILFGESGVGKTSLLNAGLFPRLREEGWVIISTRCLDNPVEYIKKEAIGQIERIDKGETNETLKAKEGFDDFLYALSNKANDLHLRIIIVIDQAEELFTLCDETDRATFSAGLTTFLNSGTVNGNFALVLSIRADYIGDLRSWTRNKAGLDSVFSWNGLHSVTRFISEEAKLAIEGPTKQFDIVYDSSLLEELLTDLLKIGGGFVYQPYLQIVCSTLFDETIKNQPKINKTTLTLETYRKLGNSVGIIASFFADKLWMGLSQEEQLIARKVTEALTTSEGLRHQLSLEELANSVNEKLEKVAIVINRLVEKRLVHRIVVEDKKQPVYELIHDFLGKHIASQLSNEERQRKEAEELLVESLKRWKKHQVFLSWRELSLIKDFKENLRFNEESMTLIFASHLDTDADLSLLEPWFKCFGEMGIPTFMRAHLEVIKPDKMRGLQPFIRKWDNVSVNSLIDFVIQELKSCNDTKKIDTYLNLLYRTKDKRILEDNQVLNFAIQILNYEKAETICVVDALNLLLSSKVGLEMLKPLGDNGIKIMVGTIHNGWYWSGHWEGSPTWYDRYSSAKNRLFTEIAANNPKLSINLLENRIWTCYTARESENLVEILSLVSNDVPIFHKILLTHWSAYARQAAARALGKISSEGALNSLVEGLTTPYSVVLREILVILDRKGTAKALPALLKLSQDQSLSEANVGYLQRAIQKINSRESAKSNDVN
jgi:hypothetical protein